MPEAEISIDLRIKGQRAGMRRLLQLSGVAVVKYRYKGEYVTAELLDATGAPCMDVLPQHADALRQVAVSQLDANPGGPVLWRRSAGTLEWILSEDFTLSLRNHPGSNHDLEAMGADLRSVALAGPGANPTPLADTTAESESPAMAG